MKKLVLFISLVLGIAFSANAQTYTHREFLLSLEGAANYYTMNISDSNYQPGYKPAWNAGFNMEFHIGHRQQHVIIIGLKGGPTSASWTLPDGEYTAKFLDMREVLGYRHILRNRIFFELMPTLEMPSVLNVTHPDGSVAKWVEGDSDYDKFVVGLGMYVGVGYYFNDFIAVFARARKSFPDALQNARYNPLEIKEQLLGFEVGMSFGIGF